MPALAPFRTALPQLSLMMAMVLWASSFVALKIAVGVYDPMVVVFGRMLVASLCLLMVGFRFRRTIQPKRGDAARILFMAFCEPCLYFLFEAQALVYTTASQAGMVTAILPVMVMVAAHRLLGERTGRKGWGGALIAVSGVIWLTMESAPVENAPNPVLGNFLEFLAMICAAGYMVTMRALTSRYSPFFLTAMQAFVGCLFYFPILFLPTVDLPSRIDPQAGLAIFYLGAVITLGAYGLYNYGLKYISASRSAAYVNLIPVISVVLGWLILDEVLSSTQIVAACVVMLGVWLTQREVREKKQDAAGEYPRG